MDIPSISGVPSYSFDLEINQWADYIELSCLLNKDKEISLSDVLSDYLSEDFKDVPSGGDDLYSQKLDKLKVQFIDIFAYIESRSIFLDEYYPFTFIDADTIAVKSNFDSKKIMYIFLLFASNTRFFTKSAAYTLTHAFESISKNVLGLMYPNFCTEGFGTANKEGSLFYGGTLESKMIRLANCLNTTVRRSVQSNKRYTYPSGDAGLDLVSFLPVDLSISRISRIPVCIAQCSCSYNEWKGKQYTVTTDVWKQKLESIVSCHEYIFVPFPIRDAQGRWAAEEDDNIYTCMIDRIRIIHIIKAFGNNKTDFFDSNEIYGEMLSVVQKLA